MKIFRDLYKVPEQYKGAVITLGNFDGFHLGHRAIIAQAKEISAKTSSALALMTFEPHPREFFAKDKNSDGLRIYNLRNKISEAKLLSVECVFLMRFNRHLADLTAENFIKDILVDKLKARHIVTGENFYFGKNRQGNKNLLAESAKKFGFEYLASTHIEDSEENIISSSFIRELLKSGNIKKAGELLGKPYQINGRVKNGEGRGQKIGFATANISLEKLFLPKFGVYAVRVRIVGDNKIYNAVANLGVKPTFGINAPLLEVHLLATKQNLYGKRLCVEFIEFIRGEQKFLSIGDLTKQIANDCKTAEKILSAQI